MTLTSLSFYLFVLLLLALYYLLPRKFQWVILLLGSYAFYLIVCLKYVGFLLLTTLTTYCSARWLDRITARVGETLRQNREIWSSDERKQYKKQAAKRKKRLLAATLMLNFGILAVLKYYNFFASSIEALLAKLGFAVSLGKISLLLPLGISFYTFQSMGYLIDVYREKVPAEQNFGKLALFVSFFPQIIQGPIAVYSDLAGQLYETHSFRFDNLRYGAELVLWGFFKKLVIADRAVILIQAVAGNYASYAGTYILLTAVVYALQLYADFSGGIDMARGVAQMFGVQMAENFCRPYFSKTLTEYWHRWHITLGSWLRNYLFYPLSISKPFLRFGRSAKKLLGRHIGKVLPTAIASLITFLVIGIWHGANWKYVAFGFWNGMVILVSTLLQPVSDKVVETLHIRRESGWYSAFSMLRTFVLVLIGYYFDIAECFSDATQMLIRSVLDFHPSQLHPSAVLQTLPLTAHDWRILALGALTILIASILQERQQKPVRELLDKAWLPVRWGILFAGIFAVILFGMYGPDLNAADFVYMQF